MNQFIINNLFIFFSPTDTHEPDEFRPSSVCYPSADFVSDPDSYYEPLQTAKPTIPVKLNDSSRHNNPVPLPLSPKPKPLPPLPGWLFKKDVN